MRSFALDIAVVLAGAAAGIALAIAWASRKATA